MSKTAPPQPQSGIFREGSQWHRYIELSLPATASLDPAAQSAVKQWLSDSIKRIAINQSEAVYQVMAFSLDYWSWLAPNTMPDNFVDFSSYSSRDGKYHAPATQRQCWIWLHGNDSNTLTDAYLAAMQLIDRLKSVVDCKVFACDGFVYRDSRDLTGFIDGSANPKSEARYPVALVAEDKPAAAGSFVLTQQWHHALTEFEQLPVAEQEQVIGRTKADSIELTGAAMPNNSHVSRTDLKVDGVAQKIYRRSTPSIQGDRAGLYFLAFSTAISRFDALLTSMYGQSDQGVQDHLLDYSVPRSGSYWFAPSQDAINLLII